MNYRVTMRRNGMRAAGLLVAGALWLAARGQTEWQDVLK